VLPFVHTMASSYEQLLGMKMICPGLILLLSYQACVPLTATGPIFVPHCVSFALELGGSGHAVTLEGSCFRRRS
jgi:hypothetical protein